MRMAINKGFLPCETARNRFPVALVILGTMLAIVLLAIFKPSAPTRDVSERHDRVRYVLAEPGAHSPASSCSGGYSRPAPPT